MTTIKCPNCSEQIEISQALQGQIEAQVLAAEHDKHEAAMAKARAEAQELIRQAGATAKQEAASELELTKQRLEGEALAAQKRAAAGQEHLITTLREDAESAKSDSQKLRGQLSEIMTELRAERAAKENAELAAQKKLAAEESKIRETATREADERQRFNMAARDKTIADLQHALDDAQRKAAQGSQQLQGEVLELDLEQQLREEFPFDDITEVKKGQRGADIKQLVRAPHNGAACGTILWETKNGKWQPAWVPKFKGDIREAGANIGVIVSAEIPDDYGDLHHLEANVWVATPKLATRLAAALRMTILQVDAANKMAAGKDAKMEALYQFLVGPEFRHRVEAIIESYTLLQNEMEKEKRTYALKWARQEKAIRSVIDNTIGMYGDLQGITNQALPSIKTLELPDGEEAEE
ncbi:MAG: hypothetical protein JWN01_751 [Patescibacteria group bacterium]|nr:hypothetical protein [Patescibacteria group bacterium]